MDKVVRQLYNASYRGDLDAVEQALCNGASVDSSAALSNETSLHVSSREGHLDTVRALLDAGADIQAKDSYGGTPLHSACAYNRLEVVRELIRRGADIFAKTMYGGTPFDRSVVNSHSTVTEFLLQHYRETIYESEGHRSLLTILKQGEYSQGGGVVLQIGRLVSIDDMVGMLRCFVERYPDCFLRERDENGDLPIHIACRKPARFPVIQYLVQQDSGTLHISNQEGALPIHLACRAGASLHQIKYLVEQDQNFVREKDGNGELPVHIACAMMRTENLELFRYLVLQDPATLRIPNNAGELPIHLACRSEAALQAVKFLVEQDPDSVRERDGNANLPIHIACQRYHANNALMPFLVRQDSATLHTSNDDGALPIQLACRVGASLQAVKCLVKQNGGTATLCARDNRGWLPLHAWCGSHDQVLATVEYLIKMYPTALSTRNSDGALPLHVLCGSTVPPALKSVECLIKSYPAALSGRTSSGDLPSTLACASSASLSVIYTLVRGDPEVIPP